MVEKRSTRLSHFATTSGRGPSWALIALFILALPVGALAQGSIFGTVQNADLNNPAVGDLFWIGFLDDTDEEIRIETNTGAGYDGANWFDDFQNYTTEAAGNPYDYFYLDVLNGESYHLAGLIPNNSFQQENVLLAVAIFPTRPVGLIAQTASTTRINVSWNYQNGVTYHVYRRVTSNNGVFRRIDDPSGNLTNAGVADSFFVDVNSDGVSNYSYLIMGEDAGGNYSAHAVEFSVSAATAAAPTVIAVAPDSGSASGTPAVLVLGTNFDLAGASVTFGGNPATNVVVVSPFELTCNVPTGTPGVAVDVVVINTASALASAPLVNGFRYLTNIAPVLAALSPQGIDEGQNLNFGLSAADSDGDSLILSAVNVPTNATFTDNYDGTGSFDFNPDFTQAGIFNVTFIVSDGALADTEIVVITVNDINRRPTLATIGAQNINEGLNLNFVVTTSDPDLDSLILSATGLPTNATFTDNYDGTGTFDFTPDFTQAGVYNVSFIVSDAVLADTEIVVITVNDVNRTPTLTAIGAQSVDEGLNLNFGLTATDPDGDSLILVAVNVPTNATFTDNFDGTGSFDFNPDFTQAGIYNVTFIASDGALADTEIVAITVNDIGLTPTLAAIGTQNVDEGLNLNFGLSAADSDGDSLILAAVNVPTNATFTDNYDGTGSFAFNPDFTQAGVYNVTFVASDGALADTEIVAITVNDINRTPTLTAIGAQSVDEGLNLNLGLSSTDPDGDSLILSAINVPTNATFTDNYDGTGSFDFNPDFTQAGIYNVTFIASDGGLADTEIVVITVNDIGLTPTLATIGAQNIAEGLNLNFGLFSTDPDGDSLILSAVNVPTNATFTDNFDGTGSFDFNPDFTQAGIYNVTFIASDGGLADTEIVAITVNDIGLTPTLAAIGAQNVNEGLNLNFGLSSTDPDGDSLILSAINVPTNATFTDNYDGTGSFDFNPDFTQAGIFNVTFIASDGGLADTEIVVITVNDVNQAPVLAAIGPQLATEGQNLNFAMSATDSDGDSLIISAVNLPTNAIFTDNYNGTASLDFNPDFLQAGVYNVTFIVADAALADTEIVAITVNDAGNQAPTLTTIGSQNGAEGANINFGIAGSDPDGDSLILSTVNLPVGATFTDNYDGTGTFDFNPDYTQAGVYNVTFIVSDAALADTEIVAITVNEAGNQLPSWTPIGSQLVTESQNLNLVVAATDPDADSLTLTAENLPLNATFNDNGDNSGIFDFTPDFVQAGIYNVTFIASDGTLADTEIVVVTVNDAGNQQPLLDPIADTNVFENVLLAFPITASDADGDSLILTAENMPANATFVDSGNGAGGFDFTPDYSQAGLHNVTFIVSDGVLADTAIVAITVNDANQPPILTTIGAQLISEGENLNFGVSATDPQPDSLIITAENIPLNATFSDSGYGTGSFDFNPDFTQSGIYNVTFIVSDGALADTEIVTITVNEVGNQKPIMTPISDTTIDENTVLALSLSAFEPDGDSLILTALDVPANGLFTDNGDGTGVFDFSPGYFQSGVYAVSFIASDGLLSDTAIVQVTVNNVNQIPVLTLVGPLSVLEGDTLSVLITAADADSVIPSITITNLPTGAVFTDSANGTGGLFFAPQFDQAGIYQLTIIASDGVDADSELVSLDVLEVGNQQPLLALIGAQTVQEGDTLRMRISATDPDGDSLILTAVNLPPTATFADSLNGAGGFILTTDYNQGGNVYQVTFIASDGIRADSELVTIDVTDLGNLAPIFDPVGVQTVGEGDTLVILLHAVDPEGRPVALSYSTSMPVAAFYDSGNGYATWEYQPDHLAAGTDTVLFIATDNDTPSTSGLLEVVITTTEVNQSPYLVEIGPQSALAGDSLKIRIVATDTTAILGSTLYMTASGLPLNASFVDSGGGVAGFVFYPDFSQIGVDSVTFRVTDNGAPAMSDQEDVEITVVSQNRPPELEPIGPKAMTEGDTLEFRVSATDPDGTIPALLVETTLENYVFVDSGNGAGSFRHIAGYTQSGLWEIKFIADDGIATDDEQIILQIAEAGNQAPFLAPIGALSVVEKTELGVLLSATDPEGDSLIFVVDTLLPNAELIDYGDGTALFKITPDYWQDSTYNLIFSVSDGEVADSELVVLTIQDAGNQTPFFDPVDPLALLETELVEFAVFASDSDLTIPILSAPSLPGAATFADSGDGVGGFSWVTSYADSGVYYIEILATDAEDGAIVGTLTVEITVNDRNRLPFFKIRPMGVQNVNEGDTLWLHAEADDPDGPAPKLEILPTLNNMVVTDNGDGTVDVMFAPDYTQNGLYSLWWIALDSAYTDADTVFADLTINIPHVNLPPVWVDPGDQPTMEGENLNFQVTATDFDGDSLVLSAVDMPISATFDDHYDGTGTFDFSPDFTQSGTYIVSFIVSDGALADTLMITIDVFEAGEAPVIAPISPQTVTEGQNLNFTITATDADGTIPILSAQVRPANSTFIDLHDGSGTFDFNPDYTQAGVHSVRFIALDGFLTDTLFVDITVLEAGNQAPLWTPIGARNILEGANLSFAVTAADPDADPVSLTVENLPANAVFSDNSDGTGSFDFTPSYVQAGVFNVTFIVSDGTLADTEVVVVTVDEAGNQPPQFTIDPPDVTLLATKLFVLRLEAIDPEGISTIMSAANIPANATFVDSGGGIGGFEFTPDPVTQGGQQYTVLFIASDGVDADTVEATYSILAYTIGDCNADGAINPIDVVWLANYVYKNWAPPLPVLEAGDINCDGLVNPIDLVYLVNFVFHNGTPPPETCP